MRAAGEGSSEPKEDHRGFSGRIVGVADTSVCGNSVQIKLASADQERFPNQQTQHDPIVANSNEQAANW